MWLRSIGLLSRRQPSDLHLLLHRADTEAKKTPRVAAPVLKELTIHAFCALTVPRRWVGAARCVVSRPSNLSSIRPQHEALSGHALHPLSWCFCPSASSSAQSGALPKRERQTDSSHILQAMSPRSKWYWSQCGISQLFLSAKCTRHRPTTRHGQDMRVFRRHMNVHCVRVKLLTPSFLKTEPLLQLSGQYFHKTVESIN